VLSTPGIDESMASTDGLRTKGTSTLTRTPSPAHSTAAARDSDSIAAFVAA
jgi:hypothetical protein